MIYAVGSQLYLKDAEGSFQRHELMTTGNGEFYLEKAAGKLEALPAAYQALTFQEVIARYGGMASEPAAPTKKTAGKKSSEE